VTSRATHDLDEVEVTADKDTKAVLVEVGEVVLSLTSGEAKRFSRNLDFQSQEVEDFDFPAAYPDWRAPQEVVLGDFVETVVHRHRGRVYKVHPGFPAGPGCPEDDGWLAGQQPVPLTDRKYERWVSILVHNGGSVVVPSSLVHRVKPFEFANDYANQYFRKES